MWPEGTVDDHTCDTWVWRYKSKVTDAGVSPSNKVNRDIRVSKTFFTQDEDVVAAMQNFMFAANRKAFGVNISPYVECQFTQYNGSESAYYDRHIDSFLADNGDMYDRKLSCVILLSDPNDFEGGSLFLEADDSETVDLKRGSVVVFPSFMAHRVAPVTSGIRHTMVGWMSGPQWR